MLNITYKDRRTNIWVRERTKVIDVINNVRKMKQAKSTDSTTTYGPRMSPFGEHTTRKDDKGDQPSGGETNWTILEGHGLAEDSATRLTWEVSLCCAVTDCMDDDLIRMLDTTQHLLCRQMSHYMSRVLHQ